MLFRKATALQEQHQTTLDLRQPALFGTQLKQNKIGHIKSPNKS
jgi:hypothetical protein